MTLEIPDSSPPGQALGTPSRSQKKSHPTALSPAAPCSQPKNRARGAYTDLSLPYAPHLTGCDSCAAEITAPVGRSVVRTFTGDGGATPFMVRGTRDNPNAAQGLNLEPRRRRDERCLLRARSSLFPALSRSPQPQCLLTPSARHWYPFGSIKKLNMMPESYKRANAK